MPPHLQPPPFFLQCLVSVLISARFRSRPNVGSWTVFDVLRNQMNMVIGQIPRIIRSMVTVDRFNDFFCSVSRPDIL